MSDRRPDPQRYPPDPLEQGLDRLVSAGRQLVGGVSGARPGLGSAPLPRSSRAGRGGAAARPRLGELGRWVEDKLEWILEDEDDWREPWQESGPRPRRPLPSRAAAPERRPSPPEAPAPQPPAASAGRRPLEAVSRRGERRRPAAAPDPNAAAIEPNAAALAARSPADRPIAARPAEPADSRDDWPDDASFSRPRWQRPLSDPARAPDLSGDAARAAAARPREAFRPLPRSSRRRGG